MNVTALAAVGQQAGIAVTARQARQRRHARRDQIAASQLSLGTLQALMGLAAYQAHAR